MSGETNLKALLKTLVPKLIDGVYVFVTVAEHDVPQNLVPRMMFREAANGQKAVTLIILKSEAEAHGLAFEFPSRMITLDVHSSLEAVGFMAAIATELARENMGVNPVSGFYHDHLFVPDGREQDALKVLERIAEQ